MGGEIKRETKEFPLKPEEKGKRRGQARPTVENGEPECETLQDLQGLGTGSGRNHRAMRSRVK